MTDIQETLIYLYGIVSAEAPDADLLEGLDGSAVRVLRVGRIGAVISDVPSAAYADDSLNARLDDLAWVGARGMEHERVLDWYAERGAVLPLSLFSIHSDEERVRRRLATDEAEYERSLNRLLGRKEWGIKLWRNEAGVIEGIDRMSASLQALNAEIESAPPGRKFLLERRRGSMRTEEVRTLSGRIAHDLFSALREVADGAVSMRLPAGMTGTERTLLLHAAYLVADTDFPVFQTAVTEEAGKLAGSGFELEFTGPWPPYNFTGDPNDDVDAD